MFSVDFRCLFGAFFCTKSRCVETAVSTLRDLAPCGLDLGTILGHFERQISDKVTSAWPSYEQYVNIYAHFWGSLAPFLGEKDFHHGVPFVVEIIGALFLQLKLTC